MSVSSLIVERHNGCSSGSQTETPMALLMKEQADELGSD
jgi:hypothetical protein